MKMTGLSALAASANVRITLFQKVLFASLIVALFVVSYSVINVLAARSNPGNEALEQAWSKKVSMLRLEMAFANQILLTPAQIDACSRSEQAALIAGNVNTADDDDGQRIQRGTGNLNRASCFVQWNQAQNKLERYRSVMRQAQTLLVNSGFDANGFVINAKKAHQSVNTLGSYLSTLRNLRQNISDVR